MTTGPPIPHALQTLTAMVDTSGISLTALRIAADQGLTDLPTDVRAELPATCEALARLGAATFNAEIDRLI